MAKRVYRPRTERVLGGVAGGLAEYFDVDPTVVRLLFVVLAFITGFIPMIAFYFVAWFIIPQEP
jgi:phage shock protein C